MLAVIGTLVAILLPAVQYARESARRSSCQNNLRQIGLGITGFESAQGRYPAGKKWSGDRNDPRTFDLAWSSFLLGYLEEQTIHDQIDFTLPFADPRNLPATSQVVAVYLCPSTSRIEPHRTDDAHLTDLGGLPGEGLACIDYLGISGPDKDATNLATGEKYGRQRGVLIGTKGLPDSDTVIEPPAITTSHITDGLSRTIIVSECTGRGVEMDKDVIDSLHGAWASGSNVSHVAKGVNTTKPPKAWYEERIFCDHSGGASVVMADGSVHFLSDATDRDVLKALCSRDGGESTEGL